MIIRENIKNETIFSTGFDVTTISPMGLSISEGAMTVVVNKREFDEAGNMYLAKFPIVRNYPSFELDIEPDDELSVVYDVYLLEEDSAEGYNIHVDRTEMNKGIIAHYEGDTPMLHCLMSFTVPPNTTDISNLEIRVRNFTAEGDTDV